MDQGTAVRSHLQSKLKRVEAIFLALLTLATIAFLLKLPYLPTGVIAVLTIALVSIGYAYLRIGYSITAPVIVAGLLAAAVAVDALGNLFHMYGREFGPVMYDEFAHFSASALTVPVFIWLLRALLERRGYQLPIGLITSLAVTCSFSAAAFYEVIEMWDELYFGGQRIWSAYDAPRDLQYDLAGKLVGAFLTYLVLKWKSSSAEPAAPKA